MIELTDEERDVLRRLVRALGPASDEFLIAGGQAARLLRIHPLARELKWRPMLTNDIDVATRDKGHRATVNIEAALTQEGFTPRFGGAGDENRRSLAKRGKDGLYVHDALQLFTAGGHLRPRSRTRRGAWWRPCRGARRRSSGRPRRSSEIPRWTS